MMKPRYANPPRECDVCETLPAHAATMNGYTVCTECAAKLLYCADPMHRLTRDGAVRAADPRTCLCGSGPTIADLAAGISAPTDLTPEQAVEYRLNVLFHGHAGSATVARR